MGGLQFCCKSGERGPGWRGCGAYRLVCCGNFPEFAMPAATSRLKAILGSAQPGRQARPGHRGPPGRARRLAAVVPATRRGVAAGMLDPGGTGLGKLTLASHLAAAMAARFLIPCTDIPGNGRTDAQ
jgi:hypothetical protein